MLEIEEMDEKIIAELNRPLAFAQHDAERQDKYMRVAQYCDEWANSDAGSFRAYYICMAGGADNPCGALMTSKGLCAAASSA